MKIERIVIRNFKSVKHIDIACSSKINAFIRENSVGKSNIFDAINWSLGPVYPSFNSTLPQDHFMGDTSNVIKITLCFDDGKYFQLAENWIDQRQNQKSGLNLSVGSKSRIVVLFSVAVFSTYYNIFASLCNMQHESFRYSEYFWISSRMILKPSYSNWAFGWNSRVPTAQLKINNPNFQISLALSRLKSSYTGNWIFSLEDLLQREGVSIIVGSYKLD